MSGLARGVGKPHSPLFMPLLHGVAAEIDALPVVDFVNDATKLRKGLSELRKVLGTCAIICAVPSAMEAEALGAEVGMEVWPPVVGRGPGAAISGIDDPVATLLENSRVRASLDATRQLADLEPGDVVLAAVLTGPATLLAQLGMSAPDEDIYEFIGRAIAGLARLYAEAGIHALVLHEAVVPSAFDAWRGALGPIANMARFHRVAPLLVFEREPPADDAWPAQLVACPPAGQGGSFAGRAHGLAWPGDPAAWGDALPDGDDNTRVVLTTGEPGSDVRIETLRTQIAALLSDDHPA
jgi:acetophenone carboxylase